MQGLNLETKREQLALETIADVSKHLYELFSAENGELAHLDRWTERRISEENLAKVALVFEADDAIEHCYQNLVREIDTEAETGIYLANPAANAAQLTRLAGESGVSGRLHENMRIIAPVVFRDAYEHSKEDLDLVWVTIEARYARAHADAQVSELTMGRLLGNEDAAMDMADALRALFYAFHEHKARSRSGLPRKLGDSECRELATMVTELLKRSGNYSERVDSICSRAGTA
ncbi:MAG: hypothetical protein QNJ00_12505 [Woeseiaceae bacterium]|nr:hypothetical protein [Woeseiaceae bacterium]